MKINENFDLSFFLEKYEKMYFIREIELSIGNRFNKKQFKTPIHLTIGQEAIAIAISSFLNKDDYIFGNHRSHGHYLASGGSPQNLISEILGKESGCSGGKGGSMHITAPETGFMGSMPIVAGTIPIAVGAGLSIPRELNQISVVYFGDGASEEGVFHESLNFASKFQVPILFVCENNFFSSHLHIDERQNSKVISRFAESHGILHSNVEGNDLPSLLEVAKKAILYVRSQKKPYFIEALTYRIFSHVGFEEDLDVGLNRVIDVASWKMKDPLILLKKYIQNNSSKEIDWTAIHEQIKKRIEKMWEISESDSFPHASALSDGVFWNSA